ncbi:MAG: RluA family pseudouridine synthase [Mariprofundaceae bacterium]|nr:RluA family pseudouridine synthase [Mariprofundaceae bacterium]
MANNDHSQAYIFIDKNEDNSRLDRVLLRKTASTQRGLIMRLIRKGNIRLNGKRTQASQRVLTGDKIFIPACLRTNPEKPSAPTGVIRIPGIIFEDEALLILNKPAGMVVHGGSGHQHGLIEQLKAHYQSDDLRLAHRLDRDTSGCLILAKQLPALRHITEQFRLRTAKKTYFAWVTGHPSPAAATIKSRLSKGKLQSGERMVVNDQDGKESITNFQTILHTSWQDWPVSLLALQPYSGRTHQLRVHMQQEGHTILGDAKYADKTALANYHKRGGRGLALHAWRIRFTHPYRKNTIDVRASWPDTWPRIK